MNVYIGQNLNGNLKVLKNVVTQQRTTKRLKRKQTLFSKNYISKINRLNLKSVEMLEKIDHPKLKKPPQPVLAFI